MATLAPSAPELSKVCAPALSSYLGHRSEIDAYLSEGRAAYEAQREAARAANPMLYKRLADARQHQS